MNGRFLCEMSGKIYPVINGILYNPYTWPYINGFHWGETILLIVVIAHPIYKDQLRGPPCNYIWEKKVTN